MKKISLLAVMLVAATALFAQSVNFGLKGGLNVSSLTTMDAKAGYHLGGLAHIHLNSQWAIQPELVYSNQGGKYTISDGEHNLNLNYINIPVLFQYMADGGFRIETGPQLGILTDVEDRVGDFKTDNFTSSDFKNTDVSWVFGLGYVGPHGLGIDARYNAGLTNDNDFGTSVLKNNVFQVGIFYQFGNTGYRHTRR